MGKKVAKASLESMYRVFTIPEAPESTLGRIDKEISENLAGFLQEHIVAVEKDLADMQLDFSDSSIPEDPVFVSEHTEFLLDKLVAQSVHTASPSFVGHMTSALPYFMLPLSKIMIALNQNLVKTETSKAFTPLERQVIGMLHRLVYDEDDRFYQENMHNSNVALGSMCSGGTVANITALWVARNRCFPAREGFKGVRRSGMFQALKHYGFEDAVVLVSSRGHYSLSKSADLLGLGSDNIIAIPTDLDNKIDLEALRATCRDLSARKIRIISLVGIAGTTETGNVDPLDAMADIAAEFDTHFHVDAAWGGPTLFSKTHRPLMNGIERADSVTMDAHKQLYVPMGAGLVVFKDPTLPNAIEHHAQYIIRKGSRDLGSRTLEGSRPGMAMLIQSGLKIIGRTGYEILIDQGIAKARKFAELIENDPDFELISAPELNILTYRYCPPWTRQALQTSTPEKAAAIHECLGRITKALQKTQRERGKSFVSRTRLNPKKYQGQDCIVFRVVLANPLTTLDILKGILEEQKQLAAEPFLADRMTELRSICGQSAEQL
ncbi:glutamate decarboxylase [Hahella sp. CCB-MM4]|uniref:pyridoxal-dependent aspartate 1-decarboxylase PanP n=1 Tax=Hahella sp. (strain CCB-MM4) TaxID=1926491 RepID=UPI000B9A33F5|nr:putative pyridoxal-dependent aspartate 1-decarboxylase [Hahella sp. CCB-MM4]OZG74964.1 glutamate decarboxylase [Hahella sp. CCB-MM4]